MNLEVIIIIFIIILFIFILSFIEPIFMKYKVKNDNEQGGVTATSTIYDSDSPLGIDFNIDHASIFESIHIISIINSYWDYFKFNWFSRSISKI